MSDEEKKAIEYVKNIKSWWWDNSPNRIYSINRTDIEQFDIVLNLTERQQKEIEELKEKNRQGKMRIVQLENEITARIEDVNQYYTPNDKIKAKIKENGKKYREIESNYTEQMLDNGDVGLDDYVGMQSIQFADNILQSLLEKE